MPLVTLTWEKIEKLRDESQRKSAELERLKSTNVKSLWMEDLDKLEAELEKMDAEDQKMMARDQTKVKGKPMKKAKANKMVEEPPPKKKKDQDKE